MIRYVKQHSIDRRKYDMCVMLDPSGLIYAYSWYLDTVCESWDALILNDYDAVWPLPVRSKYGIKYFFRPFGVQQLGVYSKVALSHEQINEFIDCMTQNCSYADVFLNEGNKPNEPYATRSVKLSANRNLVLDLSRPYSAIHKGFSKNTRRNLNKAEKNHLSIFEHDGPDVLIELFRNNRGNHLKLSKSFYRNMEKLIYQCLHRSMASIWTVYGGRNEILAGACFLKNQNRSIMIFSATTPLGKELQAMTYLLNEWIIFYSEKLKLLDFEGSNDDNLARYYAGFGAEELIYNNLKYNQLPYPLRWLKK